MKKLHLLFALSVLALAGCTTTTITRDGKTESSNGAKPPPMKDTPETVLVTYHVKPGMEVIFESLLSKAWQAYRKENLVLAEPHVIIHENEDGGTTGYVEIFTWVSHSAPEHASATVQDIWAQENSLCQIRSGQKAIGGGEVELVVPAHKR